LPDTRIVVRRSIVLTKAADDVVEGWLEDNFHHFGVSIGHQGGRVRDVRAETLRYPWSTCAEAGQPLLSLIGQALEPSAPRLAARLPMRLQCTHLFELAMLAIAHACRDVHGRRYDMIVRQDASHSEMFYATLAMDGVEVMCLEAAGSTITQPTEFAGKDLYKGFRAWLSILPVETAEQMWLMRRAFWLGAGVSRVKPASNADGMGLGAVCHSFQPEQRFRARPMEGSQIDVSALERSLLP
jgi:hypothetical protein